MRASIPTLLLAGCVVVSCGAGEEADAVGGTSGALAGAGGVAGAAGVGGEASAGGEGGAAGGAAGAAGATSSAGFPSTAGSAGTAGKGAASGAASAAGNAGVAGSAPGGAGGAPSFTCAKAKGTGAPTTAHVPAEYVARAYVEAFGRLPDDGGWNYYLNMFAKSGCGVDTLRVIADFFKSTEFLSKPLSTAERTTALARGVLLHDPSPLHVLHAADVLAKGGPEAWCDLVDEYEQSQVFVDHAKTLCDPSNHNFHFEAEAPPFAVAGELTGEALQASLAAAPSGGVVEVPEGTLVQVKKTLDVPGGVTLRTSGASGLTGRRLYPRLARLARAAPFVGPVVRLAAGATLELVWVDGRRRDFLAPDQRMLGENIRTEPTASKPSVVRWVRSDNPAGPQNIRVASVDGEECGADVTVQENLVVNWSNDNRPGSQALWSDGIFAHCERSRVLDNEVLDPSDVALIMFVSENGKQRSTIAGNRVLLAGNDAFGGLVVDTWTGFRCGGAPCDFVGASFKDNVLFSGPNTRFVFGVSTSSAPWKFIGSHGSARGAKFLHTTSGASRVRLQVALYAAHMTDTEIADNWDGTLLDFVDASGSEPPNACPKAATVREIATTSGSIQASTPGDLTDCIQ